MGLTPKELETLADHLLQDNFKDCRKNKLRLDEYPILSPSQIKRRLSMEIPYSNLSIRQRLNALTKDFEFEEVEV